MNRPTRTSQFGLVLQTLENVADVNRNKPDDRWVARMHAAIDAGAPLFALSVEQMLAREGRKPKARNFAHPRRSIDDLDADYNRGGSYPEGKW